MDRITESLLKEFVVDHSLEELTDTVAFEHFAAYAILSPKLFDNLSLDDVAVGTNSTPGIDTLAVMVNGIIVPTTDDLDAILETGAPLDAAFHFIQSKTSASFEGAKMGDFADEVRRFFNDGVVVEQLISAREVAERILSSGTRLRENPSCHLYYVTTGRWTNDNHLTAKVASAISRVEDLNIFKKVTFTPVDAPQLQRLFRSTQSRTSARFTFQTKATLPRIAGVDQSYLGVLPGSEFLKIIADENGDIHRGIFEDNVRDFQGGDNRVNQKIRDTIDASPDRFAVLNNGVTIVAKDGRVLGDEFTLEDFQIVNGCQTANVIYESRDNIEELHVPLRIVITKRDDIATSITTATNSQTQVTNEDLYSLLQFQRSLEQFFGTFQTPRDLYYERRSNQYQATSGVPRNRIITRPQLVKAFASTFLEEPHRATRYYTTLYRQLGSRMFNDDHKLDVYYASAVALFRLEALLRNGPLASGRSRAVRYHILHAMRHLSVGAKLPEFNSKSAERMATKLIDALWDDTVSTDLFARAAEVIDHVAQGEEFTRDFTKQPSLTSKVAERARVVRHDSGSASWYLTL